ncbi:MAG: glycosyltransferase [Phycisphaerales bacterium]|nr:glycosyltransferase [Phycisphaerales bacterium]
MISHSDDNTSRTLLPWLLVFLYFPFLYYFGAKYSTLVYTDYPSFYSGAKLAFQGRSPYDPNVLSDNATEALAGHGTQTAADDRATGAAPVNQRVYPYLYPPPSLLLFYPLAHVSYPVGKVAVLAVNHICLLAVVYLLLVKILGFSLRRVFGELLPAFLAIYIVYSRGVSSTIELGQVNLLVMTLLCVSWWGLRNDMPAWVVALPLAIACVFKIYPVLFVGLLVMRRKYAAAGILVALLLAACGVSWVLLPHQLWHDWIANVAPTCGYLRTPIGRIPPTLGVNVGIAGFVARLFLAPIIRMEDPKIGPPLFPYPAFGRALAYLLVAAAVAVTTWAAYRSSRNKDEAPKDGPGRIDLEFAAFLVLTFLVAPLAWEHHLVYVIPAIVVAILVALRERDGGAVNWSPAIIFASACVIGWPLAIGKLPLPRLPQILLVSLKLYAVLAIWAFLLLRLCRPMAFVDSRRDVKSNLALGSA